MSMQDNMVDFTQHDRALRAVRELGIAPSEPGQDEAEEKQGHRRRALCNWLTSRYQPAVPLEISW
jgi:hypothetical protein